MRALIAALALAACAPAPPPTPTRTELPRTLRETGLYSHWATRTLAPGTRPFTPQYPLWTDGATKRRWIHLPPDSAIDGTQLDAWQFPVGTRLWKEFSFGGPVETRFMERTADGWRYATYVWADDGSEATLAPAGGVRASAEVAPGVRHVIPSQADCRVCHDTGPSPVLGFSALQLSPDRDPGAPHREAVAEDALDLGELVSRGLLRGAPDSLSTSPPRIEARSPTERAALGYLHGNCGGCHRPSSPVASVGLVLAYSLETARPRTAIADSLVSRPSHITLPGEPTGIRVVPGEPSRSVLLWRMRSREPVAQMPPFGAQLVDEDASNLIASWITSLANRTAQATEGDPR